jgi:hypothetical protein
MNQICRTFFRHEKSRRRKNLDFFVTKKHESNLQDAASSRKKLLQKNFRLFRHEKTRIKFAGHFFVTKKAAAEKI